MKYRKGLSSFIIVLFFSINVHASKSLTYLVSYTTMGEFNHTVAEVVTKKFPPLDTLPMHHDLQLYKINYKTKTPDGRMTIASGLVAMPINPTSKVSIVSYQHGTRFERNDVPSRNNEKNYIYIAAYGNSAGFMIVMPDYLGLGDNQLSLHPYIDAETLASSSIDMLLAAKELANLIHYPISDKLYLAGYSEGGFSTLVMFKSLSLNYSSIPITAVALGSAPYDWDETLRFVLFEPGPRATGYMAYFFHALQFYKHFWANLNEVFVPPYDTLVPELFNGKHTTAEILNALPQNPLLLIQPSLVERLIQGTDEHSEYLKKNLNHYDFTPTAPLLMVGTKGDHDVPYAGAELAFNAFSARSHEVYIKSVSDTLDHVQAHPYVLKEQVEFFLGYEH